MRGPASGAGARPPASASGARSRWHGALGFHVVEVLLVVAILAVATTIGIPRLLDWTRGLRVELAAHELMGVLRLARSTAIREGNKVGVKFRAGADSGISFTLHRDGDGDGVRNRDIQSGVDPPIGPPRRLAHLGRHVRFGFPAGAAPRDPSDPRRRLDRLEDPIRFNRSDIASFNHLGGSTPGSLYVTDGLHHLSVVRLFGRTGKVKVMRYDRQTESWR